MTETEQQEGEETAAIAAAAAAAGEEEIKHSGPAHRDENGEGGDTNAVL